VAEKFEIKRHVDNAVDVVVGVVAILLVSGIGGYILATFNTGTNGTLDQLLGVWNTAVIGQIGTIVTILMVSVIAVVGFAIINYFRKGGT